MNTKRNAKQNSKSTKKRTSPPKTKSADQLSRREREFMDIIYAAGEISAAEVMEALPEPPSYSTVRKLLSILVEKGHLQHRKQGAKYFYSPTQPRDKEGKLALRHVLSTFFEGSLEKAVAAMVGGRASDVSPAELARLKQLINDARKNDTRKDEK